MRDARISFMGCWNSPSGKPAGAAAGASGALGGQESEARPKYLLACLFQVGLGGVVGAACGAAILAS